MLWEKEQVNELKKNHLEQPQDSYSSMARVQLRESHFLSRLIRSLGVPRREGSGILKEEERTNFFFLLYLGLYNNNVLCLRTVSGLNLLANSVNYGSRPALYKDYITTMYYVFCLRTVSGLNLLANSVILQCKLGSRSDEVFTTSRHSFDLLESI